MNSVNVRTSYPIDNAIVKITCLAWIASKCISWKLWLSDRLFPVLPPFDFVPAAPQSIHYATLILSIVALTIFFFSPSRKIFAVIVLFSELISCSLDQMRWQPWEYQYLLTFLFFVLSSVKGRRFPQLVALLFSATYLFSGLHKFSGGFLYGVWERLVLDQVLDLSVSLKQHPIIHYGGLSLAAAEVGIGLGLLFAKNKKVFAFAGILMHTLLLLLLGPLVLNQNPVVWPWNLGMALTLFYLFSNALPIAPIRRLATSLIMITASVILFLLPTLSFFGYWDKFLSFSIYSGNVPQLVICTDKNDVPPVLSFYSDQQVRIGYCEDKISILPEKIAFAELNVPIYPAARTFKTLKKQWHIKFPGESTFVLFIYPYRAANISEMQ